MSVQTYQRALFISAENPFEFFGGSRLRDIHILQLLSEIMEVELLCFDKSAQLESHDSVSSLPKNLKLTKVPIDSEPIWRELLAPLRPKLVQTYSPLMDKEIAARSGPETLVWVSRFAMSQYIKTAKKMGSRVVLDTHQVDSHILMDQSITSLKSLRKLPIAVQCFFYEWTFSRHADAIVVTTEIDASRIRKLLGPSSKTKVWLIPKTVNADYFKSIRDKRGKTLFFSGTLDYPQNIEGLQWFIQEVYPRLQANREASEKPLPPMVVAGSNPTPELEKLLGTHGIELHANPKSILPFLADAAVVFIPIISGGGTRLKILEAMAAKRAVISTGKGAEGLALAPSFDIEISDNPDGFTSAIIRLFEDPKLRNELSEHGLETVLKRFDWKCNQSLVRSLLDHL